MKIAIKIIKHFILLDLSYIQRCSRKIQKENFAELFSRDEAAKNLYRYTLKIVEYVICQDLFYHPLSDNHQRYCNEATIHAGIQLIYLKLGNIHCAI